MKGETDATKASRTSTTKKPERQGVQISVHRPGALSVHTGTRPATPRNRTIKVQDTSRNIPRNEPKAKPAVTPVSKSIPVSREASVVSGLVVILIVAGAIIVDLVLLLLKGVHQGLPLVGTLTIGALYGGISIYFALRD